MRRPLRSGSCRFLTPLFAFLICTLWAAPAGAQLTVFDPANYAQAVAQVGNLVRQAATLRQSLHRLQRVDDYLGEYADGAGRLRHWADRGSRVLSRRVERPVLTANSRDELDALFRSAFPEAGSIGFGEVLGQREVESVRDLAFGAISGIDRYSDELRRAREELTSMTDEFPHHRTQAQADAGHLKLQSLEIHELQNLRDLQMINIQAATTRLLYAREKDRVVDSLTSAALLTDSARWELLREADGHGRLLNMPENVPLPFADVLPGPARDVAASGAAGEPGARSFRRKPAD